MNGLKMFFETPKKAAVSLICIIVTVAAVAAGTIFVEASIRERRFGGGQAVTMEDAKAKALEDAGISGSDTVFIKTELGWDDGISVYDIEFYAGGIEYEYEINENTGHIYSKSKEMLPVQVPDAPKEEAAGSFGISSNTVLDPVSDIGVDKAKSIAVSHAGFSVSEVSFSKAKFERSHGNMTYEIEFYKDGMEYEYEINASTGEIIEFDSEWDD